jgi:hypothetical protein
MFETELSNIYLIQQIKNVDNTTLINIFPDSYFAILSSLAASNIRGLPLLIIHDLHSLLKHSLPESTPLHKQMAQEIEFIDYEGTSSRRCVQKLDIMSQNDTCIHYLLIKRP